MSDPSPHGAKPPPAEPSAAAAAPSPEAAAASAKFGAFKGVFTPSILTILGVIMYLRLGWVVGNGGLVGAIMVVLLAHVISFTTGMSISSIATNRTVKAGGDYYMISRSLGMPIGGAIGLVLVIALSLSMSLYLIGFAESALDAFGFDNTINARRIVAGAACLVLTAITFFSTSLALRIQYLVLLAIALSLASFFWGVAEQPAPEAGLPLWFADGGEDFTTLFAVFFPAVTGFTAGVAMSGDLKDPRKAIPRGTLGAILVGLLAYLAIPLAMAYRVDPAILRDAPNVWSRVAMVPQLIVVGIFAATLSSALGSVLGAPRYLQALSRDGVLPSFLGRGYGELDEPRVGTVATFVMAMGGIMIGDLDLIARVITMFFLASYGFLCLACGIQSWSGITSYRPEFKTAPWISFTGALTCVAVMFKLDAGAMAGATVVMVGLFYLLKRKEFRASPKDNWGGLWEAVAQRAVLQLHSRPQDSKNWRPHAMVYGGEPSQRLHMVHLARWLIQSRGLCTYVHLLEGDLEKDAAKAHTVEPATRAIIDKIYPEMLVRASVTPNVYQGITTVTQAYGLASVRPNTVLLGWGEQSDRPVDFTRMVRQLLALDFNLLFMKYDGARGFGERRLIDIWWGGLERNGQLMMLIGYLLTTADEWSRAQLRVNVVVDDVERVDESRRSLEAILGDARVKAEANVIVRTSATEPIPEVIRRTSERSDLVIMGLRPPGPDEDESYVQHLAAFAGAVGTLLLVRASTQFDGAAMLFDQE
ncbi:MAG: amino acid permease [Deltaproteobacteria bacterium]|jgi:amino acid transporter|nr:amino acid permease [Deltaproteobacteria bacterium]MBW2533128.1 amino acid permease [Deltaproteobacteria bacterium]